MAEVDDKTQEGKNKKCFVIMPISDVEGYTAGHFDRVYKHIIIPACQQAGYEAIRADDTSKANVIIVDILKNALNCDMAICDLSARNPNVFYELGFRQAFDKKTVLMMDDKTDCPFDISTIRYFTYSSSLRIDLVGKAIENLSKALNDTQSMKENEANSLLKLLAVDAPAKLPNRSELSSDGSLILQAIQNLGEDMQRNLRRNRSMYRGSISNGSLISGFLNGQVVKVGDHLYDKKNNKEFGSVIEITEDSIVVKDEQGLINIIVPNSLEAGKYGVMPF